MKNLALFTFLFFVCAGFSNIAAQGDSDLRDNNIRMRSADLERSKRDAEKNNSASQMNAEIDTKFSEIKEDYEALQKAQEAIVKAYTTGEKINYKQIEKSAKQLSENAERLGSNLFTTETKVEKVKKDEKKETVIKDLIVELDGAVGSFVSSAMFQNLKIVDQKVADKAQSDLAQILRISRNLSKEAGKMK